jgi:hypothetical protein
MNGSSGPSGGSLWVAVGLGAVLFLVGDAWAEHIVRTRLSAPALPTKLGLAGYFSLSFLLFAFWLFSPTLTGERIVGYNAVRWRVRR